MKINFKGRFGKSFKSKLNVSLLSDTINIEVNTDKESEKDDLNVGFDLNIDESNLPKLKEGLE